MSGEQETKESNKQVLQGPQNSRQPGELGGKKQNSSTQKGVGQYEPHPGTKHLPGRQEACAALIHREEIQVMLDVINDKIQSDSPDQGENVTIIPLPYLQVVHHKDRNRSHAHSHRQMHGIGTHHIMLQPQDMGVKQISQCTEDADHLPYQKARGNCQ